MSPTPGQSGPAPVNRRGNSLFLFAAVRAEVRTGDEETRREMRDGFSAVRVEIRTGDEETRRYMRMLFEEYVGCLKAMDEGNNRDA